MFISSDKWSISRARGVLSRYKIAQKNLFSMIQKASNSRVYEAQLEILDATESKEKQSEKIELGLFLLIYIPVYEAPGSSLTPILGDSEFTVTEGRVEKLSTIAFHWRHVISDATVAALASEAMQEAFLYFKAQKIRVNAESLPFFTLEQGESVYSDNFLCAMFDIKARAKINNISNKYVQILENAALHFNELRDAMLHISGIADEVLCIKLACFIIVDSILLTLKYPRNKTDIFWVPEYGFFQKMASEFLSFKVYIEDKGSQYDDLRKRFIRDERVQTILFNNVVPAVSLILTEVEVDTEVDSPSRDLNSFIAMIRPTEKDRLLISSFSKKHAWIFPNKIPKTSKAREVLADYRSTRSKIKIQAADRALYEAQLEEMAQQEEDGIVITDSMMAGLFLLVILSIQARNNSGILLSVWRNGFAALFDAGFDDEATGSRLEQVLGRIKFSVPNITEPVTVSCLADSCIMPYSRSEYVAFSSVSIQETFLLMHDKTISVRGTHTPFFSQPEKELVYGYSYLCAMQDICVRAEEKNIFPKSVADKNIVCGIFKIVENTMKHLFELAEGLSTSFPELSEEKYRILRAKAVCFLVLSRVYSTRALTDFLPVKTFLEIMLKAFFSQKTYPLNSREQAYYLSRQFFRVNFSVLLESVPEDVASLFLSEGQASMTFLAWTDRYDFHVTLRDTYLFENFLAGLAPITGSASEGACAAVSIEL